MDMNFFKSIVDNVPQPVWILDVNMKLTYSNNQYKSKHINTEDLDGELKEVCKNVINNGEIFISKHKNYDVKIIPLKTDGKIEGVACIELIRQPAQQNVELKEALDTLPAMVFYKDKELNYVYANKKYNEIFETKSEEVLGKKNIQFNKYAKLVEEIEDDDEKILVTGQTVFKEITIDEQDGITGQVIKTPIKDNNKNIKGIAGIVIDVTDRKRMEEDLKHLSYTDVLTNVYNRTYFEKQAEKVMQEGNFPIGVIMGDANGLKLVNDTLGHSQGDKLLVMITDILREACNETGMVFRIGGDEFAIILPKTKDYECENIIKKIFSKCRQYNDGLVDLSISLGSAMIYDFSKSIFDALKEAEEKVYRQKILQGKSLNSSVISSLQATLEEKSLETEEHTTRVAEYAEIIGRKLSLPLDVMDELILVAKLHDIGKVGIDEQLLLKKDNLSDEEFEIIKSHTEKGYRIIKAANHLESVAMGVLTHHERWDGQGYPLKLSGEKIPLLARIVNVADAYDIMMRNTIYRKSLTKEEAIKELEKNAGKQFDPDIVKVFVYYLKNDDR